MQAYILDVSFIFILLYIILDVNYECNWWNGSFQKNLWIALYLLFI